MQMTFITTLKPGKNIPFLNAVRSWRAMGAEVLVEGGNSEQAAAEGYTEIPTCKLGLFNLPYLDNLLHLAQPLAHSDFLVLTSDHLIFLHGLSLAIEMVSQRFDDFLIVGRHWELSLTGEVDYGSDWARELETMVGVCKERGSAAAKDYFVFPNPLGIKFAPFLAGREWWDTWLLWEARSSGIPVVDVSSLVFVVHPKHMFLSLDGTKKALTYNGAGKYNKNLFWSVVADGFGPGGPGSIDHTPYKIVPTVLGGWKLFHRGDI